MSPISTMTARQNLKSAVLAFYEMNLQDSEDEAYAEAMMFFRKITWLFREKLFCDEFWIPIQCVLSSDSSSYAGALLTQTPNAGIPSQFYTEIVHYVIVKLCTSFCIRFKEYFSVDASTKKIELLRDEACPHRDIVHIMSREIHADLIKIQTRKNTVTLHCLAKAEIKRLYFWGQHPVYRCIWTMGVKHEVRFRCRVIQRAFVKRRGMLRLLEQEHIDMIVREIQNDVMKNHNKYLKPNRFLWARNAVSNVQWDTSFLGNKF